MSNAFLATVIDAWKLKEGERDAIGKKKRRIQSGLFQNKVQKSSFENSR